MTLSLDDAQALIGFGMWAVEAGGVISTPQLRAIYGEPPATLADLIARVHDDDRAAFADAIERRAAFDLEHRIVRTGGAIRLVRTRASAQLVATVEDITERQEQLAHLVFADRMKSIATLAGGMAHEINNPLGFIAFNLENIQTELRAGTDRWREVDAMLGEAREGVQRIQGIVRGVSLFARRTEDLRIQLPLGRVIDSALAAVGPELRHRARIVLDTIDAPMVRANETRLVQVFVHLLRNACAAIPEGRASEHEIRIAARPEKTSAIIEIADTGHGIPPADTARVFDPFYTTRAIAGGTGLGLSICHGIVESLGGEISVRSEIGAGTVFTIRLPAEPPDLKPLAPLKRVPRATRRGKVLIVDDEVAFAGSLQRGLGRDHDVVVLRSGRDALAQIRSGERFDAILCDLMMPEITGMELHARLLELAPEQADRMVFVTGGAFTVAAQHFLERLRTPWFEKPCSIADLRAAVDSLVR